MKRLAFSVLFVVTLVACATGSGVRAANRERLNSLSQGMTKEHVLKVMGTGTQKIRGGERITNPYRSEAYNAGGFSWEVLFYYTDIKRADDAITDDELTPIVLKDGKVDGWGWTYWQEAIQRFEIRR